MTGKNRKQIELLPGCIEDYVCKSIGKGKLGSNGAKPNDTGRPSCDPCGLLKLYISINYEFCVLIKCSDMSKPAI
jgi:hypothetical protein